MENYFNLARWDVIQIIKPLLTSGMYYLNDEGKITCTSRPVIESPWIHTKIAKNRDCNFYNKVFFPYFNLIHSRCQECWKVVVKPKTLRDLMKLYQFQQELQIPSKCGIETREYTFGPYGGYFYTDSLKEGREIYQKVREGLPIENFSVILKRGCTEFELKGSPSETWEVGEYQKQLESLLDKIFIYIDEQKVAPDFLSLYIMRSWIRWAYHVGDKTYLDYTNGQPLYPEYKTYHEES